jgi:hypothetical protein
MEIGLKNEQNPDSASWIADNERLVLAGLRNEDDDTLEAVKQRCVTRFGEDLGSDYYRNLLATFPDRHKELFPEIFESVTHEAFQSEEVEASK